LDADFSTHNTPLSPWKIFKGLVYKFTQSVTKAKKETLLGHTELNLAIKSQTGQYTIIQKLGSYTHICIFYNFIMFFFYYFFPRHCDIPIYLGNQKTILYSIPNKLNMKGLNWKKKIKWQEKGSMNLFLICAIKPPILARKMRCIFVYCSNLVFIFLIVLNQYNFI
jgi:hypothetical protein